QHRSRAHARRRAPQRGRTRQQEDGGEADDPGAGAVQLHRGGAADRLAAAGSRAGRQGLRADGGGPGAVAALVAPAAAVPLGDQPHRRVRGGRRALRLGQAGRLGSRRGGDGGPVRPRVPEGNVTTPKRPWRLVGTPTWVTFEYTVCSSNSR